MTFDCSYVIVEDIGLVTLTGELDAGSADRFRQAVEQVAATKPRALVLFLGGLDFIASAGLRVLVFAKQKMGAEVKIYVLGARGPVLQTLQMSGFDRSVYLQEAHTA
jgi:anti-anti-sigma factor